MKEMSFENSVVEDLKELREEIEKLKKEIKQPKAEIKMWGEE